jgi:glycerol-1-phosphate dehydrogenase [NAD(P)+]
MNEILNLDVASMAGLSFNCSCGKKHEVDIKKIVVCKNASDEVIKIASAFKDGKVMLLSDNNTYAAYGSFVETALLQNGFKMKSFTFKSDHPLVPDERSVGRLLIETEADTALIITVGSGTLNDLTKYMCCRLHIPYIIVCTAPSMDGYASVVSPIMVNGFKNTLDGIFPYAIIADIDILKNAPIDMIHAGFGDILGKLTALADWKLSTKVSGEYYCETSEKLVRMALDKCIQNAPGITDRNEEAIKYIMEALILSGVAMGLVGNSRPASGAEHHLAHFWEMDALARNADHALHGNSVGIGTLVISAIYEMTAQKLATAGSELMEILLEVPSSAEVAALLNTAGACDNPAGLGISRELFKKSILHAMEIRERFSVLRFASGLGFLEEFGEELTEKYY